MTLIGSGHLPPARLEGDRNLTPMKTRLILTACASALLLGLPAAAFAEGAAPAVTTAAQGGVAVPPLGFNKRVLANGMEVYTARDASTSNVTVQVWYRVGS